MKNIIIIGAVLLLLLTACASNRQKLSPQANLNLKSANVYYQQKDIEKSLEKALSLYEKVLQDNPQHVLALKRSADLNLFFATAIEPKKNEKDGIVEYRNMDKAHSAIEYFKITYPRYNMVLDVLNTFPKLNEDERAIKRDAQKKKESSWVRMFRIGQYQFENKLYNDAINTLEYVYQLDPKRNEPLRVLVAVYQETKNEEKTEYFLNKVLEVSPDDIGIIRMMGDNYYNRQMYDKAIPFYEKILNVRPLDVNNMLLLSSSYIELKKYQNAYEVLVKVLKLEPNNKDVLISAKELARVLGNQAAEIEYMKKILTLDSSKENLEEFVFRMINFEKYDDLMPYAEDWYYKDTTNKTAVGVCITIANKIGRKDLEKKYGDIFKTLQ